jgi:hypothetical protein
MPYPAEPRVDDIIFDPRTQSLINVFFDDTSGFEGNLLERIGQNHPTNVTLDDLLAITMLDVGAGPLGVRRLIYDAGISKQITSLLKVIPPDADVWNPPNGVFGSHGKAEQLWKLLQKPGTRISGVTAGKLLARKRPRLIPIVDRVVKRVIDVNRKDQWDFFVSYLSQPPRQQQLIALMPPNLQPEVSVLRLLDVAIWMWESQGIAAQVARQKVGL